jgi:hypothetical protein
LKLIIGGFDNEEEGVAILEKIAQIISNHRIVEHAFLKSSQAPKDYSEVAIELYATVLEYQAIAAQNFGKHTLTQLGLGVVGLTDWKAAFSSIQDLDNSVEVPFFIWVFQPSKKDSR